MPNRALTTPVTNLDFDSIKNNLKTYLSGTEEFSDFDYEGSGINVLLDLLAYNTHYMALYTNMLASESFIDSAVLRRSIVSLAKNLGYVPKSRVSSTAIVDVQFGTTAGVPSTVPQGTKFYATKDGTDFTFTTTEAFSIDKSSVPYTATDVEIRQGIYKSASFIYSTDSNSTKFEILSDKIDRSLTKIYVMASPSDLTNADISWKENSKFIDLTATSKVYFINENYRGNYEVSFGDGIFGAKPDEGSFITIVYFETDGLLGNDIGKRDTADLRSFEFGGIGGDDFNSVVTTTTPSYGGGDRDSSEKVRYTAPKFYQAQDRAVTVNDFESIILSEYSAADAVRVWGGEENDPPMHGKVFVSILPKNTALLSDKQKEAVKRDILDKKKIVSVTPELVDPDYTFINVNCRVTYDSGRAFVSEPDMRQMVSLAIRNYFNLYLGKFNGPFRYSSLSRLIDLSSNSVVSNRIDTTIYKKIIPTLSSAGNYTLDFGIPINHPYDGYDLSIVKTSVFKHKDIKGNIKNCFIEDNGRGRLTMYTYNGLKKVIVKDKLGTLDYATGKVSMSGFNPVGTGELAYIVFEVTPDQRFDIIPKRNQVLTLDPNAANPIRVNFIDTAVGNY
jgi:hypothetical protein